MHAWLAIAARVSIIVLAGAMALRQMGCVLSYAKVVEPDIGR